MREKRYTLSAEGVDELMKRLTSIANDDADSFGFLDAQITPDLIKRVTKVEGLTDVINRNEDLSKTYASLLAMYGFDSMYDMYMYAKSCENLQEMVMKRKDYSKLVPVKRKVMRNGKETEVTVYEDPNKGGSQPNEGNTEVKNPPGASHAHARELKGKVHGTDKKLHTKDIAKLKQVATDFSGKGKFKDTSDFYLELKDAEGQTTGIIGYSDEGEYLVMDFFVSSGQVNGIAARGFSELINLALEKGKGVKMADDPQARPVLVKFGLEQHDNEWSIDYKTLSESLGVGRKDSE